MARSTGTGSSVLTRHDSPTHSNGLMGRGMEDGFSKVALLGKGKLRLGSAATAAFDGLHTLTRKGIFPTPGSPSPLKKRAPQQARQPRAREVRRDGGVQTSPLPRCAIVRTLI